MLIRYFFVLLSLITVFLWHAQTCSQEMQLSSKHRSLDDYPNSPLNAQVGDIVLAPLPSCINRIRKDGPLKATMVFRSVRVIKRGAVESRVRFISDEATLPNWLLIPIPKGSKAQKGDIVLTWWQGEGRLQRGYVIGGTSTEPVIRYIDFDADNPTGMWLKQETLPKNSFRVITENFEPGAMVAFRNDSLEFKRHGMLIHVATDVVAILGFAGSLQIIPRHDVQLLPLRSEAAVGERVWVSYVGTFREGTVTQRDPEIGRITVQFEFANKMREYKFPFGYVKLTEP